MKKIVCEMCGSNDLLKKDGVFECQSCGTKYSVEEAKKMMVDGVVNIEGTVKIDDSNKINNLIKNAKILFRDGKTDESYKLFGDVLNIDTENYTAITYRGLCSSWNSSIASPKIGDAVTGISRGFEIAKQKLGESEEYAKFCMEIMGEMSKISVACMKMYQKHYKESYNEFNEWMKNETANINRAGLYYDVEWSRKRLSQEQARYEKNKDTAINGIHLTLVASNVVVVKIITVKNIEIYSIQDYKKIQEFVKNYMVVPSEYLNKKLKDYEVGLGLLISLDEKIEKLRDLKRTAYWEEHKEEKQKLESEIEKFKNDIKGREENLNKLDTEKKEIEKNMNSEVASESELKQLDSKLETLIEEKSSLGLFKIKEKKAIQEKIDALEEEKEKLNQRIETEKNELKKQYQPSVNEKEEKIKQLDNEIKEIQKLIDNNENELKKDRD